MVKYSIKIFARMRPTKGPKVLYNLPQEEEGSILSFTVPRQLSDGIVNNRKEQFLFKFNRVFNESAKQDDIFSHVVEPVINNCLEGYNGTIFAYGQTGSGKTFTITGGAERYCDRGIIPRTLSYLFHEYSKHSDIIYTTHISYLEIYNENGYDLLDPKHEASKLEDLPKVTLFEDSEGCIHLKNLSLHQSGNEEEALNWLFLGDTNRIIAETPMNMASTRSHCIFTIHISSREVGCHTVRKAKLHLVDLAGSERVSKSGVNGTLLTEARYINLSLHYLEQVIVALSEKCRSHIPYRNSMMTSVLRDSLGGNCMTTMIATVSIDKKNLEESLSTCKFAQRVALVKNDASLNEELDPKLMVAKLKQQVLDLKQEIALSSGEERQDELTEEEKDIVSKTVEEYIRTIDIESRLQLGHDVKKIQLAFEIMKKRILSQKHLPIKSEDVIDNNEIIILKERLQQRDEEINILLKMLKQERLRIAEYQVKRQSNNNNINGRTNSPIMGYTSPIPLDTTPTSLLDNTTPTSLLGNTTPTSLLGNTTPTSLLGNTTPTSLLGNTTPTSLLGNTTPTSLSNNHSDSGYTGNTTPTSLSSMTSYDDKSSIRIELSKARQEAFDMYRKEIGDVSLIEKHKTSLRAKYSKAKALGETVNISRLNINKLKSTLEKMKIQKELNQTNDDKTIREQMEIEKQRFKGLCNELKTLKTEIEHIQHLLESSRLKLQNDFDKWWINNSAPYKPHPSQQINKAINIQSSLLTGNTTTDNDIIGFYKARQKLINKH